MDRNKNRKAKVSQADKDAARRLKAIFNRVKGAKNLTQEKLGDMWGDGGRTQGAIGQYMNGIIPLNLEAVTRFAELLECRPQDIRDDLPGLRDGNYTPSMAAEILERPVAMYGGWPFKIERERYERLSAEQRASIDDTVKGMVFAFEAETRKTGKAKRRKVPS